MGAGGKHCLNLKYIHKGLRVNGTFGRKLI